MRVRVGVRLIVALTFALELIATLTFPSEFGEFGELRYLKTITVMDVGSSLRGGSGGGVSAGTTTNFTADQIFNNDVRLFFGTSSNAGCEYDTAQTPDAMACGVDQASRVWWFREQTDTADYALAQQVNPTVCFHSAATTANQYGCVAHDQTNFVITAGTGNLEVTPSLRAGGGAFFVNASNADVSLSNSAQLWWTDAGSANTGNQVGMQHARVKTLTESAATTVIEIPVAASAGTGGRLSYSVFAADATDQQLREGSVTFAISNKAGTETCTLSGASEAADGSVIAASVGTLTYAITCSTAPTNAVDIQINAVSSLTQTTLEARIHVLLNGPGVPTFP